MNERPEKPRPTEPKSGRDDETYPQDRSEREMGTHEGGKNRPPHPADALHGDLPSDLPPKYEGR